VANTVLKWRKSLREGSHGMVGSTENAGMENAGTKLYGWKMEDWKMSLTV